MKRFWLVLLSLGLVMAFSASAFAVDVQFSGSIYEAGVYLDRVGLAKDPGSASKAFNTAFFYQRLRLRTDFIAAPGVKVVTRFDAMERVWGGARTAPSATLADAGFVGSSLSGGTQAENENIAFDWAYISYDSPIGTFRVGYQDDGPWGTIFGDTTYVNPRIIWIGTFGPIMALAAAVKLQDNSFNTQNPTGTQSDKDNDKYAVGALYMAKWGQVGLLGGMWRYAYSRAGGTLEPLSQVATFYGLLPYAKVQIGPVAIQAEVDYVWGKYPGGYDSTLGKEVKLDNIIGWVDALVTLGPVYFGGTIAYVAGDDPGTTDKMEGGALSGGRDWDPCLIMWNYNDRGKWIGAILGNGATADGGAGVSNAWLYQGKVGVKPIPKLDVYATVTYATVDKKPVTTLGSTYGWEIDLVGTYKITNNLSYMLGGAYWFVGDYYKGLDQGSSVRDDFMVINKLTLTF